MNNFSQESIEFENDVSFDVLFEDNINPENILSEVRKCVAESKNDLEIIRAVELALGTCIRNRPVDNLEEIFRFACPAGASVFVRKIKLLEDEPNPVVDECTASYDLCLKIVAYFQDAFEYLSQVEKITISRVESLLRFSLDILLKCFFHCKGSEEIYGSAFAALTEPLSRFFKTCCGLLDNLLDFLTEKSALDLESEREISLLDELLRQVSKCGIIMVNLEVKTMAKIWKTYIYLLEKYLCVLRMEHKIGGTINALCEVIISNVEGFKDEDTKLVKLSCFLLKLIIKFCELFKNELRECHSSLFKLFLTLCKCEGGLMEGKNQKEELVNQLTVGMDPLLSATLAEEDLVKEFRNCQNQQSEEFCLLYCLVLKKLSHANPSVRCLWINERENIFEWIFCSASTSQFVGFSSVRLPNVVINWKKMKYKDLYEYVLVTASAFLITASADEFCLIEKTLIRNVLQPNIVPALLAMDMWCFLARIAEPDLCYNQILALSEMYRKVHGERVEKCFLASLIRRLFLFLADNRQKEYLKRFPSTFYSSVWNVREIGSIPADDVCGVVRPIVSQCCHLFRKLESKTQASNVNGHVIYMTFGGQILDLWKFNRELLSSNSEYVRFLKIACGLVAWIVSYLTSEELLYVLSQMKMLLSVRGQPTVVKLYFLWILNSLSTVSFPADGNQRKILLAIVETFRELLSSRETLVKQKALEVFEAFTRVTTHEEVIGMVVQNSPALKTEISDYFKKKPIDCPPEGVEEYLRRLFKLKYEHMCEKKEFERGSSVKRIKLDIPDLEGVIARFKGDGNVIREHARSLSEAQIREIKNVCSSVLSKV